MSASFTALCPKSVTYVLNLKCYLCSEPAPGIGMPGTEGDTGAAKLRFRIAPGCALGEARGAALGLQ